MSEWTGLVLGYIPPTLPRYDVLSPPQHHVRDAPSQDRGDERRYVNTSRMPKCSLCSWGASPGSSNQGLPSPSSFLSAQEARGGEKSPYPRISEVSIVSVW